MRRDNQVKSSGFPWGLLLLLSTVLMQLVVVSLWFVPQYTLVIIIMWLLLSILGMGVIWILDPCHYSQWLTPWVTQTASERYQLIAQELRRFAQFTPVVMRVSHSPALAYAIGAQSKGAMIGLDETFLDAMKPQEVEAIIAHEMGHIALGHTQQLTLLQAALMPLLLPIAAVGAIILGVGRRQQTRRVFFTFMSVSPHILLPLTSVTVMMLMRHWEYAADRYAANLVGKPTVLATLRCLHGVFMPEVSWNQVTAFDDRRLQRWLRPFTTHPSIPQRITALWRQ